MLSSRLRSSAAKTDNSPACEAAKAEIRRRVLAEITPAHVLDAFCGAGVMHREVWHGAASYVGIDQRWFQDDRRVYIGETHLVLRSIPLRPFNVFDIDAYGSPWQAAWIVAKLRRWLPGELIGLVLTYGSGFKLKLGGLPRIEAALSGLPQAAFAAREILFEKCLSRWLRQVRGSVVRRWEARGSASTSGMYYTGMVVSIAQRGPS